MHERSGIITFKGDPLTLVGRPVEPGQQAPDFNLLDVEMNAVGLSAYRGKVIVLSTVPSIDTEVCSKQTRRFNEAAAGLADGVVILTVSMDLPFAQKRWCAAAGIEAVKMLSDYRDRTFGPTYGLLVKELQLLARSVSVIGPDGDVTYVQLVEEMTEEPDYPAALAAVETAQRPDPS